MEVHRLECWRMVRLGSDGVYFRPGGRMLARRVLVMAVFLLVAALLVYSVGLTPTPEAARDAASHDAMIAAAEVESARIAEEFVQSGLLKQEEIDSMRRDREAQRAQRIAADTRLDSLFRNAFLGLAGVFAAMGVLAPLGLLWERFQIRGDGFGGLAIRRRGLLGFSRSQHYGRGSFQEAGIRVREHIERPHRMGAQQAGWLWEVLLFGGQPLVLCIAQTPHRPLESGRPPSDVQALAEALAHFSGCPLRPGFAMAEAEIRQFGPIQTGIRYHERSAPALVRETFSLDDVPEDLRRRLEENLAQGGPGVIRSRLQTRIEPLPGGAGFRCTFPDGREERYHSVEALPPELREMLIRFGGMGPRK